MATEHALIAASVPAFPPAGADPFVPRLARIASCRHDSGEVWTLDIREELPQSASFRPGQFNMLTVFGVGEVPISFSGAPAASDRLLHTVRAVGPVSTALVQLPLGASVGVRGPFGNGWPVAEAAGQDVLIVAGGLGLAPLRPVIYELLANRARYGRIAILYGTRGPDEILFRRELESWRREGRVELHVTVDHATSGWDGNVGVVTTLVSRARFDPGHTIGFVCGPEVMMRLTSAALRSSGVADEAIYLSLERNMKCAVALCGRCQLNGVLVCREGPVFRNDRARSLLAHKEL
ncbi:MAG TPA: FAD/NAD(P)-binding protein [Steroidobacteraceae bacterium]|nr:FAD/NAD(P)-binding protein [Steroidobacteraceae bacterium]